MSKKSEITITVETDQNQIPEQIKWRTTDDPKDTEAKAIFTSIWDPEQKNTLRIDLWNKEMTTEEMKIFVHQTMLTMADTFERATDEKPMAMSMRDFCEYFAEKMNLV